MGGFGIALLSRGEILIAHWWSWRMRVRSDAILNFYTHIIHKSQQCMPLSCIWVELWLVKLSLHGVHVKPMLMRQPT